MDNVQRTNNGITNMFTHVTNKITVDDFKMNYR
jgi:hypothetical protein